MMIEQATVVAYANGVATVQCFAKGGCGGCSAKEACGTTALSALTGKKTAPRFTLPVPEPLAVGMQIQLGLPEKTLLNGVLWLYCFPLFVLVVSTLLFSFLWQSELFVAFLVLLCTGGSFTFIKWRLAQQTPYFQPIYLGKITK